MGHQLVTGIANLSPSNQPANSAAERASRGRGEEVEEPSGGDPPGSRGRGVLEEQQRYSVIMDRYERLMERYHTLTNNRNRELDWPERGASRAVDQPELVAAAVREDAANRIANTSDRASPMRVLTPEGASRLLTDSGFSSSATHTSTSTAEPGPSSDIDGAAALPEAQGTSYPSLSRPGLHPNPPNHGPRYRRYSLLLDREDLDVRPRPRPRLSRGVRGREGARLRRVDTFREPGDDWASYRRELRERMLELRRLRDISRAETRSTARDIQPASSILDLQVCSIFN